MTAFLLVLHLLIAVALIGTVLLQRSEGGALGIGGGGGGMGGSMSGRGASNALTRTTAVLALCFFLTSIVLSLTSGGRSTGGGSVVDDFGPLPVSPTESTIDPPEPAEVPEGPVVPRPE